MKNALMGRVPIWGQRIRGSVVAAAIAESIQALGALCAEGGPSPSSIQGRRWPSFRLRTSTEPDFSRRRGKVITPSGEGSSITLDAKALPNSGIIAAGDLNLGLFDSEIVLHQYLRD